MSNNVDLSVVIVSHNVAHLIGDCLESLFREQGNMEIEIFLVDSASTDGTADLVRDRFPGVRLQVSRDNIGFSAGNNLAIPQCRGRYIALLNPDTIVRDGTLCSLVRYLDGHPSVGAAGPTLRLANGRIQPECARNLPTISNIIPWLLLLDKLEWKVRYREHQVKPATHPPSGTIFDRFNLLSWSRDQTCEVEYICGACMMIRHEVIQHIGLLDETCPLYLDDIDYCRRIRNEGWSIHFVAQPTIIHLWEQSSSQLKRQGDLYAMQCHAIWLYLRKHHGSTASMIFTAASCLASLLRVCICLAALALHGARRRNYWQRHLSMALGLGCWAFRFPKTAPRFGFLSESQPPGAHQQSLGGCS